MARLGRLAPASVAVGAVLLGLAPPGLAQVPTPSLSGETLEANPVTLPGDSTSITGTCDKSGTTTLQFQVTGAALGPYLGRFTETGTIVIGPQTDTTIDSRGVGAILGFEASFTIESELPPATITGTKTLAPGTPTEPDISGAIARCDPDGASPGEVLAVTPNQFGLYEAQIDALTGSRSDSGNTSFALQSLPTPGSAYTFLEVFNSAAPQPAPPCADDSDEQGDDPSCDDDEQ